MGKGARATHRGQTMAVYSLEGAVAQPKRDATMHCIARIVLFSLVTSGAAAADLLQPISLGPFQRTQNFNGVDVHVPYNVIVTPLAVEKRLRIDITIAADLNDIAANIGRILATLPLPRDNCRSFSPDNPVVSLDRSSLHYRSGQAVLALGGTIVIWACLENPVHKTKVEMQMQDLGFGVKTKVPVVVDMGPGDPIKTIVASQPFDAEIPVRLIVSDAKSIRVELDEPTISLGGKYASITKGILSLAGVDINAKAGEALQRAVDPDDLRQAVPSIAGIEPNLSAATFVEKEGHLAAQLEMSAVVDGSLGLRLFQALLAGIRKGH